MFCYQMLPVIRTNFVCLRVKTVHHGTPGALVLPTASNEKWCHDAMTCNNQVPRQCHAMSMISEVSQSINRSMINTPCVFVQQMHCKKSERFNDRKLGLDKQYANSHNMSYLEILGRPVSQSEPQIKVCLIFVGLDWTWFLYTQSHPHVPLWTDWPWER